MNTAPKEPTFLDARDRIWSLYLESAEKRGKSRLEQWKGDTDGILIFTGLFAATVATFVVSTLPSLSPDSASQTVNLLAQVLAVLANNSETSSVNLTTAIDPSVFEVPRSAIQVNTLWLISLCLSLSSALAATLVQQWARTYVRDAHRHTKVATRGLVHAALEYGIARFRMEHSAAAIMFLLHASVFLFYAGLLVLLFSMNAVIAQILAALMGIVGLVYFGLSLMPIVVCDTPYHTPISPLLVLGCRTLLRIYVFVAERVDFCDCFHSSLSWAQEHRVQPTGRGRLASAKLISSLSKQTRIAWHRYAFKLLLLEAADELHEVFAFWESYMDFVRSSRTDITSLQRFIRSDVDVYQWLAIILKAAGNDEHDFSRVVVLACELVRHVLDFRATTPESARSVLRKLRFTFFQVEDYETQSRPGLRSSEAQQIYVAQVHNEIMNIALRDRAWLDDFAYRDTVARLCDALGLSLRHSILPGEDYSIGGGVVSGFIKLLTQILSWKNISTDLVSSTGASWLSVVQHIHTQAIVSAGVNTVAAFYVDAEHLPIRLRPDSDLAKLLLMLDITDYKDLGIKESRLDGLHPLPLFSAVHPRYQQLFSICPELAHMLHSLCVMLIERRDVSKIYPFFNAAPPRTTMPYELRLASPISNSRTESPIINRVYAKPAHVHDTVAFNMLDHAVLASDEAAAVQQWEDLVSTRRDSSPRRVMLAPEPTMPTTLAVKDDIPPELVQEAQSHSVRDKSMLEDVDAMQAILGPGRVVAERSEARYDLKDTIV